MISIFSIYIAIVIDSLIGDPYWFPHPVRFVGKYILLFEKIVKKLKLKDRLLKLSGIILSLSTVGLTYGIVFFLLKWSKNVHIWLYYSLNVMILWTCIAPRCLQREAMKIYNELKIGNLFNAREKLSYIVGRDTDTLDESEVIRAVVETVSENTSDGVIAPLMYMFIGGAPLALAYKAINTLDSMVGYKQGMYFNFGWFSAKLDDVANFIPARLSALCILISSFVLRLDYKSCGRIIKRDKRAHTSPNSGYPESAVAGALGIQIGGVNSYFNELVYKPTIGDKIRDLNKNDIIMTNKLMYTSLIVASILCSLIIIIFKTI